MRPRGVDLRRRGGRGRQLATTTPEVRHRGGSGSPLRGRRLGERKGDGERRPLPRLARNRDVTVVNAHKIRDEGEPHPGSVGGAGAGLGAAPEAVEDVPEVLGRDSHAGVRNLDHGHVPAHGEADGDPAARVGVPQRVRQEVVQDLRETLRIADDARAPPGGST